MTWDWAYAWEIMPTIGRAAAITLQVTLVAFLIAVTFGLVLALLRRSQFKPLRWLVTGFVEFVRSTPPLVQLYFIFFVFPHFGLSLSPFAAGAIGLGIHYSTYTSEVYRAGIEAVDRGQWEAAKALNFSPAKTWQSIILPQALPPIIPMLGNYLIVLFKETPLVGAISLIEMLQRAVMLGNHSFRYLEPITIVGIYFLIMSYPAALLVRRVERRVKQGLSA